MIKDKTSMTDRISFNANKSMYDEVFMKSNKVEIYLYDEYGQVKDYRCIFNTVTASGKAGAADQILASPSLTKPTHMAVGSGSPGTGTLGGEQDRNALASKTRAGATVTMSGWWAAGDATGALTEAGIFDVVTDKGGNMWQSASFSVINKGANDTLGITWTLAFN